jgi:hypothetical protein
LICRDLSEYEELAVSLAQDTHRLYEMRLHLEKSRDSCALFDTERWVRNLEQGMMKVWEVCHVAPSREPTLLTRHSSPLLFLPSLSAQKLEKGQVPKDVSVVDEAPVVVVEEEQLLGGS